MLDSHPDVGVHPALIRTDFGGRFPVDTDDHVAELVVAIVLVLGAELEIGIGRSLLRQTNGT